MTDVEEGVRRLESTLAGTRMHAARGMRDLHAAMQADLRQAERRAGRAERQLSRARARTQEARVAARRARARARRAEQQLESVRAGAGPSGPARRLAARVCRWGREWRRRGRRRVSGWVSLRFSRMRDARSRPV